MAAIGTGETPPPTYQGDVILLEAIVRHGKISYEVGMSSREKQDSDLQRGRKQLSKTTLSPTLSTWWCFTALVMDQFLIRMTNWNLPLPPSTSAAALNFERAVPGFGALWLLVGDVWLLFGNVLLLVVGTLFIVLGTFSGGSGAANLKTTVCKLMCGHLKEKSTSTNWFCYCNVKSLKNGEEPSAQVIGKIIRVNGYI